MTRTLLLAACLAATAVLCVDIPAPAALLADRAKYDSFLECIGGKQPSCEPWVKDVLAHVPDALKTGCASCPSLEKDFIRTLTLHMKNNDPEKFQALAGRFDKDKATNSEAFKKFLESTD